MARSVDYLLVTAAVGAVMRLVGSMSWGGVVRLAAVFTQITQILQAIP